LGGTMATVDNVYNQGAMQNSGRALDVGISGEGFFALDVNGQTQYTRAGNFYTDNTGDLVNGDGAYVLSMTGDRINIPAGAKSLSIGKDGQVSYVDNAGASTVVGQIQVVTFANNAGLSKVGANNFIQSQNSGEPNIGIPGQDGRGELVSGALEMSNVDLSEEFTEMIVAQRGFQANTRIITTSDEILQELVNLKR
ncbi:MAG: flagellar hook-basal body complex protein, partial [Exiguobacterium chiriqhucha]